MSRRRTYQRERSRSQRDGGIGMAMYRMEERERKRKENNRLSKAIPRELGKFFRKPRKPRRR